MNHTKTKRKLSVAILVARLLIPIPAVAATGGLGLSGYVPEKVVEGKYTDLQITGKIRDALHNDPSLSEAAKNIKIGFTETEILLQGAVDSAREIRVITKTANRYADRYRVSNQTTAIN